MKKTFTMAALSLAVLSSYAHAQETTEPEYENWIGIFGTKYKTSPDRPLDQGIYDDGEGFGLEYGFRFTQSWAARVEYTALELDYLEGSTAARNDSGHMIGADAMYFMPNDWWYLFGGFKHQSMDESFTLGNIGIGKHWNAGEKVKFITEIAAYQDFGEDYNDYSVKLGLAIAFGGTGSSSTSSAPKDSDSDGVVDSRDQCPMTPMGVAVDSTGCAVDADNDGVMNNMDQCPNTPAGAEVDARGCEITIKDSDNDGVADADDQCADTPMGDKVDSTGCTVFDEEDVSITLRVLFDNESSVVKQPNDPEIQEFANFMKRYGNTSATIEGHTSAPGSESYNMQLSQARADAFRDVLVQRYDIEPDRLETVGYGETQLLDTSGTAEAHRVNRRISVTVSGTVKVPEER
ncbi:OmpA family protein [Alteromonas antoniana]|uniref:OmpA family protein n=1 Tax=Alteromonas antoniana TaxID=2803813 RepID=UPI001C4613C2|nr:OmpA family protein [Alteromonas antoniana]